MSEEIHRFRTLGRGASTWAANMRKWSKTSYGGCSGIKAAADELELAAELEKIHFRERLAKTTRAYTIQ